MLGELCSFHRGILLRLFKFGRGHFCRRAILVVRLFLLCSKRDKGKGLFVEQPHRFVCWSTFLLVDRPIVAPFAIVTNGAVGSHFHAKSGTSRRPFAPKASAERLPIE